MESALNPLHASLVAFAIDVTGAGTLTTDEVDNNNSTMFTVFGQPKPGGLMSHKLWTSYYRHCQPHQLIECQHRSQLIANATGENPGS